MRTHQQIDARSLALHQLIAARLRSEPTLFENCKSTLTRWRSSVSTNTQPYLQRWEQLFEEGLEPSLNMATDNSQLATALRQCSPFVRVLTNTERWNFLNQWNSDHASE
jgi:hypothetical protein